MEFVQPCQSIRIPVSVLKSQQFLLQRMRLPVQRFDGLETQSRTMAGRTFGIQPRAEAALVVIQRRRGFTPVCSWHSADMSEVISVASMHRSRRRYCNSNAIRAWNNPSATLAIAG